MIENNNQTHDPEWLSQRLAEQSELRTRFEAARVVNEFKNEIGLEEKYKPITEFRMDRTAYIVQHLPTTILNLWPSMTGPNRLKKGVESWIDELHQTYPPKQEN